MASWVESAEARQKQIAEIEELRKGSEPTSPNNFMADVLTRRLIADFIRPNHHRRVTSVLTDLKALLYNDERLVRAIEAVCVGHGLNSSELADADRYPFRSDIRGEAVNVRLLAVLLRLADLLDLSSDRACPLVMSAASPLPRD